MAIESNAAPEEMSSPYYIENKKTCEEFESYVLAKNGQTKGKYNAWSYVVTGKIPHKKQWYITIKKTTLTSGNLILSSNYQSLQYFTKWSAKKFISDCPKFKIFRSKWSDFILTPQANKITIHQGYSIISKNREHKLVLKILATLDPLFKSGEIWEITYSKNQLTIESRTMNDNFSIIDKLFEL